MTSHDEKSFGIQIKAGEKEHQSEDKDDFLTTYLYAEVIEGFSE